MTRSGFLAGLLISALLASTSCTLFYNENYYQVNAKINLAMIQACEFNYYRQNGKFCGFNELYQSYDELKSRITAQATDDGGYTYSAAVTPDGQSFIATATGSSGTFTKQANAADVAKAVAEENGASTGSK